MDYLRTRHFRRSFATGAVFILLALLLWGLWQARAVTRSERGHDVQQMQAQAALLARAAQLPLRNDNRELLQQLADIVSIQTGLRVTLIGADGRVRYDSMEDQEEMDNHLMRPEVQQSILRGAGDVERYSNTLDRTIVYHAVPVRDAGEFVGVVRIGRAREDLDALLQLRYREILRNSLIAAVLLLAVAFVVAARHAAALQALIQASEAMARGEAERRVPRLHHPDYEPLGAAINQMARSMATEQYSRAGDRKRLAAIFAGLVEGVIDVDPQQQVLHLNDAAAHLLDLPREQALGKPLWELLRHQGLVSALDEALRERAVVKAQLRLGGPPGGTLVELHVAPLASDQGEPLGAILVLHDVTGIRQLERVRTDFVANASHELKTPITAIRGLAETAVDDGNIDITTLRRFMGRIHEQSLRLSQLVADLMTLSRLEGEQGSENFCDLDLGELAMLAVNSARMAAEAKGLELVHAQAGERLRVSGDREQLSQLLDNLLDNAIKYTPEGGRVELRLASEGGEALLEVEDNGIGIAPQDQERIFERFYRVDKVRSRSLGGSGLGLSIVRNVASRHGGAVSVRSQPGHGSLFRVRLPLTSAG